MTPANDNDRAERARLAELQRRIDRARTELRRGAAPRHLPQYERPGLWPRLKALKKLLWP